MKKFLTLSVAVFMSLSAFSQKVTRHHHFADPAFQKTNSADSILSHPYSKYRPQRQNAQDVYHFKSTDAVKQQLDMVYAAEQDKDEYRYDSKGNMIEDIYYEWDTDHWQSLMKSEYVYDMQGNNTLNIDFNWNTDHWENDMKYEYAFDSDGNITQYISSIWQETQYINLLKEEFTFDDKGNQTQDLSYYWDGAQWEKTDQSEFTYNANGELTAIVSSTWDGSDWIISEKFENVYNPSGKISQSIYSVWEEEQWTIFESSEYEYDSIGNMTLLNVFILEINIYREESVYDEFGNQTENSVYEGNWDTGVLEKSWKTESIYDNDFTFEDLILPFTAADYEGDNEDIGLDLNVLFKHKLLNLVNYEGDGDNWVLVSDYILVYSEQNTTGTGKESSENRVRLYPNPAGSQVTFTLDGTDGRFQIEVFDIQGKMVMSQTGENNKPISIESLGDGIYFYHLESKGNTYEGKLLVKK